MTSRKRLSYTVAFVASVITALLIGCFATPSFSSETSIPSTRHKYLWPFASTSPWNMPIGSNARYISANFARAAYAGADREYFFKSKDENPWNGYPWREVYAPGAWAEGRCTGTKSLDNTWLPIPDDLIIPDATNNPYHTPNNASAFLMPDGKTLIQLEPLARCQKAGPVYGWRYPNVDIYGDGIGGAHFGSGLSSIGGSIRQGELISKQPIHHALKVVIWGEKYLYYSGSNPGYRWPADRADSNAANQYHGKNPSLVQGTLLAIPPNVTEENLNLQTPAAKKLFHALQDYGAYVVDDAGWDSHYFAVEQGVTEEFRKAFGYDFEGSSGLFYEDFMNLFQALYIVDNNGPDSIGGGGTPRVALAPPIGD
ncbi:hypothetical protein DP117_15140 [Brasilonema sp. UFV-L1]|nr:hypothetical protein [Brasilonema sp. UFV-L1]NMG08155.1 hypothetical protein [Brasilonema sp. UFV-L1]